MAKKDQLGLLLVTMEPPASLEEEFADWYDTEHVPERAVHCGVERGGGWRVRSQSAGVRIDVHL